MHQDGIWEAIRRSLILTIAIQLFQVVPYAPCHATWRESTILNPRSYQDAKKKFSLYVNPSNPSGAGEGEYVFKEGDRIRWSAKLPFTLTDACVSESGKVAGFGYTTGYDLNSDQGNGELVYVIISQDGVIELEKRIPRQLLIFPVGPPEPWGNGLFINETNDQVVFRFSCLGNKSDFRKDEEWSIHRLSSGEFVRKFILTECFQDFERLGEIESAESVAGTPLSILRWELDTEDGFSGIRLTLLDDSGKVVWWKDLTSEYGEISSEVIEAIRTLKLGIQPTDLPGQFDVLLASESNRVKFSVTAVGEGKWQVQEVSRAPFTPPAAREEIIHSFKPQQLRPTGRIVLQKEPVRGNAEAQSILCFAPTNDGRVGYLFQIECEQEKFALIDSTGRKLAENALDVERDPGFKWNRLGWIGDSTFLALGSVVGKNARSICYRIDFISGKVVMEDHEIWHNARDFIGFANGEYVIWTWRRLHENEIKSSGWRDIRWESEIVGCDRHGNELWRLKEEAESEAPDGITSIDKIVRTSDDKVLILNDLVNVVLVFDRSGKFERRVDLPKEIGGEPIIFISEISADIESGWFVGDSDFHGNLQPFRITPNGQLKAEFQAKYPDGRTLRLKKNPIGDEQGNLWGYDGFCLSNISDNGLANPVLGEPQDPRDLRGYGGLQVGRDGTIYVLDFQTCTTHVFDQEGRFSHVLELNPTDLEESTFHPVLIVAETGETCIAFRVGNRKPLTYVYAHFSKEGKRLPDRILPFGFRKLQPKTGNPCISNSWNEFQLINPRGEELRRIQRQVSRNWFESANELAFGPEGEYVVFSSDQFNQRRQTLSLYRADGEGVRDLELPEFPESRWNLSYGRDRVVAACEQMIVIHDVSANRTRYFENPLENADECQTVPFLLDGKQEELLLWGGTEGELLKFAID